MSGLRRPAPLAVLLVLAACGEPDLTGVHPDLGLETQALDFGALPVLTEAIEAVELENRGAADLDVDAAVLSGADAAFFRVAGRPERIGPAGRAPLEVAFRPEAERAYAATLTLTTNDPETPAVVLSLQGEGRTAACLEVVPGSVTFERVPEGGVAVETFELRAGCTAPLRVEAVALTEDTPAEFEPVGSWQGGELAVGSAVPLSVAFRPRLGQTELEGTIRVTSTDPDRRVVDVPLTATLNRAPVAVCGEDVVAAPGDVIALDGLGSHDPDGDVPLAFAWELASRPPDSLTELAGADTAAPTLELDVAGAWDVRLRVTDAAGVPSPPCWVRVQAVPADDLYLELVWDHPVTDLDLHLLAPGGLLGGPGDCAWTGGCDFGVPGVPDDDPVHGGDDLAGFGPEWLAYDAPPDGTYELVVAYAKSNGAGDPTTRATLRVYVLGVLAAELVFDLQRPGEVWRAATVAWPSGRVGEVTP